MEATKEGRKKRGRQKVRDIKKERQGGRDVKKREGGKRRSSPAVRGQTSTVTG